MPLVTPPPVITETPLDREALLEQARRRAQRRRRRNGAAGLIVGLGVLAAVIWHGSGSTPPAKTPDHAARISVAAASQVRQNGPLTVIKQEQGRGGVYVVGPTGLARMLFRCPGSCLELQNIAWSPDGTKIALGATSYASPSSYDGLHVLDLATGRDRQLTGGGTHAGPFSDPAWSPDGAWLAYDGDVRGAISLSKADGSRTIQLATGLASDVEAPTWSPDGTSIAFQTTPFAGCRPGEQAGCTVYVIRLDGTHLRLLARHASAPAWSPLGTTIAYQVRCGIRLVTPTGTAATPHSTTRCQHIGMPGQPIWSPDGKKIAINSGPGKTQGIYIMNANGTHLTHLTRTTGRSAAGIARAAWRPRTTPT